MANRKSKQNKKAGGTGCSAEAEASASSPAASAREMTPSAASTADSAEPFRFDLPSRDQFPFTMENDGSLALKLKLEQAIAGKEKVEADYHDLLVRRDAQIEELQQKVAESAPVVARWAKMEREEQKQSFDAQKAITQLRGEFEKAQLENKKMAGHMDTLQRNVDFNNEVVEKLSQKNIELESEKKRLESENKKLLKQKVEEAVKASVAERKIAELQEILDKQAEEREEEEQAMSGAAEADREAMDKARESLADIFPDAPPEQDLEEWVEYIRECKEIPNEVRTAIEDHPFIAETQALSKSIQRELDELREPGEPEDMLENMRQKMESLTAECLDNREKLREKEQNLELGTVSTVADINPVSVAGQNQPSDDTTNNTTITTVAEISPEVVSAPMPWYLQLLLLLAAGFLLYIGFTLYGEYSIIAHANDPLRQHAFEFTSGVYDFEPSELVYNIGTWLGVDFTPLG